MINIAQYKGTPLSSLQDAERVIHVMIEKMVEIEEREISRDQGLTEEIIHLRKETHEGFSHPQPISH